MVIIINGLMKSQSGLIDIWHREKNRVISISRNKKIIIGVVLALLFVFLCIVASPFVYLIYYGNFGLDNDKVLEKSIENVSEHYDFKYEFDYIDHEDNIMGFFGVSTTPSIELSVKGFNRHIDASFERRILAPFIGFKVIHTDLDRVKVYEEIENKANKLINIDDGVFVACCEYSPEIDGKYNDLDTTIREDKYTFDYNVSYYQTDEVETLNMCIESDLYNNMTEDDILGYVQLLKEEFDLDFIVVSVLKSDKNVNDNVSELLDNSISYHIGYLGSLDYSAYDKIILYDVDNNMVVLEPNNR